MSTLIVIDQSPYGGWAGREALDMAFALAAFDRSVALLFTDAGVNWLRKSQQTGGIEQKSVEKNLSAAVIFGVEALYADADACLRYGLTTETMITGVTVSECRSELLQQHPNIAFSG